jgi:hypothetical protein
MVCPLLQVHPHCLLNAVVKGGKLPHLCQLNNEEKGASCKTVCPRNVGRHNARSVGHRQGCATFRTMLRMMEHMT